MLGLPKSTEFNKRIPKEKFYENLNVTPTIKKFFVDQIKVIYWRNKIAPTTINLAIGTKVTEIEVFEIKLKQGVLDEAVLRQIDKEIPYHIIFLLEYDGKYQVWISHKESASGNVAFKVNKYYHTKWIPADDLSIKIEGFNMDAVWDNLIVQIGDIYIEQGKSLNEQIEHNELRTMLKREIAKLEKKARNEKQPKKKFELVQRLNALSKELEIRS